MIRWADVNGEWRSSLVEESSLVALIERMSRS